MEDKTVTEISKPTDLTRRTFLQVGAGFAAASALPHALAAEARPGKLAAGAFALLPLGEIAPAGWLKRQLQIQADGLGGHLDEVWDDVGPNSGWLGGKGESWERGPYFLDGLLPLAWQLNDPMLKAKAMKFINWTLDNQQPNGMIGPASNNDWWPRMVMLKVLAQYHDATSDPRVMPVLTRYFHYQLASLPERPLADWGKHRWQDEVLIVQWLYDRTADPKLLALGALLEQQGFDWVALFKDYKYTTPTTKAFLSTTDTGGNKPEGMQTHGVNNGQALKTAAVRFRMNHDAAEHENYQRQVATLDRYHGMPSGMFSCDEHLAGLDPSHGTELCTVVETMFSMEVALAVFGDARIGDRIEKIAYNALPGTFTDNMWGHQYDQQPNQIQVSLNSKPWTTNGPESNLFGLEPNFGCCTANFHQGWPKLTSSLWMRTPDDGLVAALYAPCAVTTKVRGQRVHLKEETDYPFRNTVRIIVNPDKAIDFALHLRVPEWTDRASLTVNGGSAEATLTPGTFAEVKRTWKAGDVLELKLPMKPQVTRWFAHSVAVTRGPLVFSLHPGESWVKLRERGLPSDWQVFPERAWNYALAVDEASAAKLEVVEAPVGARPFAAANPAVRVRVRGRRLNAWRSEDGVAGPVPAGLQDSKEPEEVLELIPYGAAKLRVTAFPQLRS